MTLLRRLAYRLDRGFRRMTCKDCWRHFEDGWRGGALDFLVATAIWNFVMADQHVTSYIVKLDYSGVPRPQSEGVGGVVCLACFDRRARAMGVEYRDHLVVFGTDCWMGGRYAGGIPL